MLIGALFIAYGIYLINYGNMLAWLIVLIGCGWVWSSVSD